MKLSNKQLAALGFRPSKKNDKLRVGVISLTASDANIKVYLANALMAMLYKLSTDPKDLMGATEPMTGKPAPILNVKTDGNTDKVTIRLVRSDANLNTARAYDLAEELFTTRLGITGKKLSIKKLANKLAPLTAHLQGYDTEVDDDDDDSSTPPWDTSEYKWQEKVADYKPDTDPVEATTTGFDEMADWLSK